MSTIVERPMSVINDAQPSTSRSRRDSIEIIDVDSLDHGGGQPQPVPPANVRRGTSSRDSIWIEIESDNDNDDEVEILSSRVLSSHSVDRARSHRQFISPPPPRTSNQGVPPVPIVPVHARQPTRQPARRQANVMPGSMPIFPSASPPAFEVGPVAGPSNAPNPPLQAAPISRHLPALGLGGALISSNNRAQTIRQQARAAAAASQRNAIQGLYPDYNGLNNYSTVPPHIQMYLRELAFEEAMNPLRRHQFVKQPREREQYQQHYTHPSDPEPGFTYDFAPSANDDHTRTSFFPPTSADEPIIIDDDDDNIAGGASHAGPSTPSGQNESSGAGMLNAVLVCAKCLDPLVLNASLEPEEGQFKRVWGLRCGHLIDEKCLNELGQPPPEPAQDEPEKRAPKDRKGKGKAKAVGAPDVPGPAVADESNSIRSRLRSRPNAQASSSSASSSATTAAAAPAASSSSSYTSIASASYNALSRLADLLPSPPAKKRRGPAKKPKIEGEFEWRCPVAQCGRVHISIKVDGVWGPETERDFKGVKGIKDEARGAVAVFA